MLDNGSVAIVRDATLTNSQDLWLARTEGLPTVSTNELSWDNGGFTVSPNPLGAGGILQLTFEDPYLGPLDVGIYALDGRRIGGFSLEKTAYREVFEVDGVPGDRAFWVRVSDGRREMGRMVVRP